MSHNVLLPSKNTTYSSLRKAVSASLLSTVSITLLHMLLF